MKRRIPTQTDLLQGELLFKKSLGRGSGSLISLAPISSSKGLGFCSLAPGGLLASGLLPPLVFSTLFGGKGSPEKTQPTKKGCTFPMEIHWASDSFLTLSSLDLLGCNLAGDEELLC